MSREGVTRCSDSLSVALDGYETLPVALPAPWLIGGRRWRPISEQAFSALAAIAFPVRTQRTTWLAWSGRRAAFITRRAVDTLGHLRDVTPMQMGSPPDPPPWRRRDAALGWGSIAVFLMILVVIAGWLFNWRP